MSVNYEFPLRLGLLGKLTIKICMAASGRFQSLCERCNM